MENRFSRKRSPRLEGKRWIGCWADHSPSSSFCKSKLSDPVPGYTVPFLVTGDP
jgi:hypothetical protein